MGSEKCFGTFCVCLTALLSMHKEQKIQPIRD